jgi:hypothetical protein
VVEDVGGSGRGHGAGFLVMDHDPPQKWPTLTMAAKMAPCVRLISQNF